MHLLFQHHLLGIVKELTLYLILIGVLLMLVVVHPVVGISSLRYNRRLIVTTLLSICQFWAQTASSSGRF